MYFDSYNRLNPPHCQVLQGIRLIKYYAWEQFYTDQIAKVRSRELETVRRVAYVYPHSHSTETDFLCRVARGGLIAMVTILPVLSAILSFVCTLSSVKRSLI